MSKVTITDRRPQAPGDLTLVQALVNTWHQLGDEDEFATPAETLHWLHSHQFLLSNSRLSKADWLHLCQFRTAIRQLLLANNGEPLDNETVAYLNGAARHAPLITTFDQAGQVALTTTVNGIDRVVGCILEIVFKAMVDNSWNRLKACRNPACQWAFYDTSKNRSGVWCTMEVCGSRHKARTCRQRQRREV